MRGTRSPSPGSARKLPNGVEIRKAKIAANLGGDALLGAGAEARGGVRRDHDPGPRNASRKPLADALGLSDWLLEVEITPNGGIAERPGRGAEVASITGKRSYCRTRRSEGEEGIGSLVRIDVSDPALCPRYSARVVTAVTVAPRRTGCSNALPVRHPADQQRGGRDELPAPGDGQPMHAFDLDRLRAGGSTCARPGRR